MEIDGLFARVVVFEVSERAEVGVRPGSSRAQEQMNSIEPLVEADEPTDDRIREGLTGLRLPREHPVFGYRLFKDVRSLDCPNVTKKT